MQPVYGDTDSLFISNPSKSQIDWLILKTKKDLGLDLAVDVIYSLCVLSAAKKAYFGILPDGYFNFLIVLKDHRPVGIRLIFDYVIQVDQVRAIYPVEMVFR